MIALLAGVAAAALLVVFVAYIYDRGYKQGRQEESEMWKMCGYKLQMFSPSPSASPSMSPSPSMSASPSMSPSASPSEEWNGVD